MKSKIIISVLILFWVGTIEGTNFQPRVNSPLTCHGYALSFDGLDDYLEVPDAEILSAFGSAFTLEFWINVESYPLSNRDILGKWGPLSHQDDEYGCNLLTTGAVETWISGLSGNDRLVTAPLPQGTWNCIAEVFDATTATHKLYLNGVLQQTHILSSSFRMDRDTDQPFRLGQFDFSAYGFFPGRLDEIRLWSISRTQSETQSTMNKELSGNEPSLAGYWNLNEGGAQVAKDKTTYLNHGRLGNSTAVDAADPTWISCDSLPPVPETRCLGFALSFDGINDYAEVPDQSSLSAIGSQFTLEFWMKLNSYPSSARDILGKWGPASNADDEYGSNVYPNGTIDTWISGLSGHDGLVSQPLPLETWTHVAEVFDAGNSTHRLYLNGILQNTHLLHPSFRMDRDTDQPLRFGQFDFSANGFFPGQLDEIRIWQVARTQIQIQADLKGELSGSERGLVGYWKFNEGAGQLIKDQTPYGNHGRLGATFQSDTADPTWIACDTTQLVCGLVGDLNQDGLLTLADARLLLIYIHGRGQEPDILCTADLNADGRINQKDFRLLIHYLFKPGVHLPKETCCE